VSNKYLEKVAGFGNPFSGLTKAIPTALGRGADMAAASTRASRIATVQAGRTAQINAAATYGKMGPSMGEATNRARMGAAPLMQQVSDKAKTSLGKTQGLVSKNQAQFDSAELNMHRARTQVAKAIGVGGAGVMGVKALTKGSDNQNTGQMNLSGY